MNICDTCSYYVYDEEAEEYYCDVDMDEDDRAHLAMQFAAQGGLMSASKQGSRGCPYYRDDDEYKIVRHQM